MAAVVALGFGFFLHSPRPIIAALVTLIPYGITYLILTAMMGIDEAAMLRRRLMGFIGK